jgi:hypothetical protein
MIGPCFCRTRARREVVMRRVLSLVFVTACAVAGLWGGYWLGYLAGWSKSAKWPTQIGGGAGAIALSIVLAVVCLAIATAILVVPTFRTTRRLLLEGTSARGIVLESKRAGLTIRSSRKTWDKISCRLDVQPFQGASFHSQAYQFMTAAEEAALRPDTLVEIRYDPGKPQRAAIVGPARI